MKYGYVKVAAATPYVHVADCQSNAKEILKLVRRMEKIKVKVMVFPELCITGYTCEDLFWQKPLLDGALEALKTICKGTRSTDALIFVGLPLEAGGKLYNAAAVLCHGEVLGFVPKCHLPNHNEFYEQRHFTSGLELDTMVRFEMEEVPVSPSLIFRCEEMPELTVGAEICEDLWVPMPPSIALATAGAHIIVNLSASNEMVGKDSYRRSLVTGQSARLVCGYVYASAGEGESSQDLVFGGQNLIAENGTLLAEGKRFFNGILSSEIDLHRLADERRRLTTYRMAEPWSVQEIGFSLKKEDMPLTRRYSPTPFVPSDPSERDIRCEEILNIQSMGLKKRLEHIHMQKTMVGLSGGLDSTLALLVMARTADRMGISRDQITCVTMPCFGTTDRTYHNACELSRCLGAELREISIKEAVTQHFKDIGHDPSVHDVTYENSQARERTQVLMDLANQENALLVGTGDLSELALGWATYNGDHMSMYGVNASVPKTLVRHLVSYYADTCKDNTLQEILYDILDTPVSPELLPPKEGEIAQKTEDLIGPYELHDFFLYYMLRAGFPPEKLFWTARQTFSESYDAQTILKWMKNFYRRFFSQQFKRSCLPDGPKVGSVALSPRGDLRMPSDACADLWLKELDRLEKKLTPQGH